MRPEQDETSLVFRTGVNIILAISPASQSALMITGLFWGGAEEVYASIWEVDESSYRLCM